MRVATDRSFGLPLLHELEIPARRPFGPGDPTMGLARLFAGLAVIPLLATSFLNAPRAAATVTGALGGSPPVLTVLGPRAFSPNGDGRDDVLLAAVTLAMPEQLHVAVDSFEGTEVAVLFDGVAGAGQTVVSWDGGGVPDGPYTLVATAADGQASIPIARWSTLPLLSRPHGIVVVLDPGHGGSELGAPRQLADGTTINEKDVVLDVALKAGAMLAADGFVVRYTRTADVDVPLETRTPLANSYRGDAFVSIHMNALAPGEGRTEDFFCLTGCRESAESQALAQSILDAHRARLAPYETGGYQLTPSPISGWTPTDDCQHWVEAGCPPDLVRCHYAVLGPYSATLRPNAIAMPAALVESLALTSPAELALMADPAVRTQVAAAYADGIATFFATRPTWVRIDGAPTTPPLTRGHTTTIRVRLTNTGAAPIPAGSAVVIGDRSRISVYDADSALKGRTIGSARLLSPLAPGAAITVPVAVIPRTRGSRTWKVDLVVNGVRVSDLRVPTLQLPAYVR